MTASIFDDSYNRKIEADRLAKEGTIKLWSKREISEPRLDTETDLYVACDETFPPMRGVAGHAAGMQCLESIETILAELSSIVATVRALSIKAADLKQDREA